jgi:lipid II:glycine glycyltransferase (peptidoglycan interpeptide bridge formation enzyme)
VANDRLWRICPNTLSRIVKKAVKNNRFSGRYRGMHCSGYMHCMGAFKIYRVLGRFYITRRPLLCSAFQDKASLLKTIIPAIENICFKNRIREIKILWSYKSGNADSFTSMGYQNMGTNISYTVDISKGPEALWESFCGNKRRNIKKALANGVEFEESTKFSDIEKFYNLVLEVAKRHKSPPEPISAFQTIWKLRGQKNLARIFFAKLKGKYVSSVFVITHVKTVYVLGFGYDSSALEVRPNDLLHWKIMEWGCKRGFLSYYMGDVYPEQDPGLWRWKREWRGSQDYYYVFKKPILTYSFIKHISDGYQKTKSIKLGI